MPIKLITLNIEGDKHFDTVLPFLQEQNADVVCLQEVFEADLGIFVKELGGQIVFTPLTDMSATGQTMHAHRGIWGIATWVSDRIQLKKTSVYYYRWDAERARHSSVYDMSRAVICISIRSSTEQLHIANTHFTWTPDGKANEQQRIDLPQLLEKLEQYPELILCGDFNAPRGEEIFSQLCKHFTDNLPPEIVSTVDPKLHKTQGKFDLAVDTIFSTPGYQVKDVQVFEGISDHKAIIGTIQTIN